MTLPTKCMRSAATPSAARCSAASRDGRNSSSESRSVRTSLISSALVESPLRNPASTCPTGTCSFAATSAAASVAAKLQVPVGHVEAGLRSGDSTSAEEINDVLTDRLSELLFLPSRDAAEHLAAEGVAADRMHFVGNVMIDTLSWALPQALALDAATRYGVQGAPYAVVTLHQPGNVDDRAVLRELLDAIERLGRTLAVVFPVHPRTRQRIRTHGLRLPDGGRMRLLEPLGYLEMLGLVAGAALVVTDSGGLQDETSFLGVPCLTVRSSTERPITCTHGTNRLVLPKRDAVLAAAERALARRS